MEEMFSDFFHRSEAFLRPQWDKIEKQVQKSPTKAVLVSMGIGYVLHRLPVRSLLTTNLKLLWAFAPPAIMAAIAGKGLHALEEYMETSGGRKPSAITPTPVPPISAPTPPSEPLAWSSPV